MAKRPRLTWITGASSGLGLYLAKEMASKGWGVAISARSEDTLRELAAATDGFLAYPCDITDEQAVRDTITAIENDHGEIDVAVLNAGTHQPVRAADLKTKDFDKLVRINLMGTVNCLAALTGRMMPRGRGQIAVVASVAGYRGLPTSAAYGMTKAGLINMTEALRPEMKQAGVKLQLVCPGFVRTPLTDQNEFDMPFLMEPEPAAKAFYRGLMSNRFEIVFPWQMKWAMKLLRILPNRLFLALSKKMIPDDTPSGAAVNGAAQ